MSNLSGMMGRKVGMIQVFSEDGQVVPVTVLEVGPCTVLQKKTAEREGYNALQFGFSPRPLGRLNLPEQGHVKRAGLSHGFRYIREISVKDPEAFDVGQVLTLKDLEIRQLVDIAGVSKGRGFAGTIKRHGFSRGPMGHGSKHHRAVGSVGQSATPSRVIKGKKMPGRMGGKRVTVKNSMVVDVRPDENLLLVKGCVPGSINQLVYVLIK
ncbi:MAG: 50S ribosomal protein L3 [Deltaproteobacteria bacterium]|nr:50S ribosomal protein L3 [Deltaproteobacteria bacterium]MBW1966258.1 50S ribosomal protein L3 [Deltaproteobacteria bacterium]MBW2097195.1 50S ribosomal protein L3 [Deltaproteobacteria bacterium]PXF53247.1 MAG: 50S ribosomal protein L3 [Deltaproteobacteria bacterium]